MKLKLIVVTATLVLLSNVFLINTSNAEPITGSGSTFAANFIDRCRVEFVKSGGDTVTYSPNGSGAGKNMFSNGIANFAMSDVPYSGSEVKPTKEFVYVPLVAGPIGIIYRLDGYKVTIKMSTDTLAKIFSGKITKWNDPQILKENLIGGKEPKIPSTPIRVAYRVDGSGTSEVFTSYLNVVSPSIWTKAGNKNFSSSFPGSISSNPFMMSASGSYGVAMVLTQTNGSIGYNEISYARGLKMASIQNESGRYMQPTVAAASVFLSDFLIDEKGIVKVNYKTVNKLAYPISTFTYGIASKEKSLHNESVKKFFEYMANACGKKAADLGYSPLGAKMLKFSKSKISEIGSK